MMDLQLALEQREEDDLTAEETQALSNEEVDEFLDGASLGFKNPDKVRGDYVLFLSHFKLEAGTEAALMRTELELLIREDMGGGSRNFDTESMVFLDSEDLLTLEHLQEQVRGSQNLALLLTSRVLSRPWVLVEIVTAIRHGVQVVPVELHKTGNTFQFPDEAFFASIL